MSKVYWPLYEVFVRSKQGLSHRHVGSLHAADDQMALENARDAYTRRSEGCSIWVVKALAEDGNHQCRHRHRPFRSGTGYH